MNKVLYKLLIYCENIISVFEYLFRVKRFSHLKVDHSQPILYFCHTPYHIMSAIVDTLTSGHEADIMLYPALKNAESISLRLKESKIFKNVYIHTADDKENQRYIEAFRHSYPFRWKKTRELMEREHDFSLIQSHSVYIFNDFSVMGYYLTVSGKPYRLVEDGLNFTFGAYQREMLGTLLQNAINYCREMNPMIWGCSPLMREVDLNSIKNSDFEGIFNPIVYEKNRRQLLGQISLEDKEKIIRIFEGEKLAEEFAKYKDKEITLILTSVLSECALTTEEKELDMLRSVLKKYSGECVVIKPHPRNEKDLHKTAMEYGAVVLQNGFVPIEMINFFDIKLKRLIAIRSTAAKGVYNVDELVEINNLP